MRITDIRELSMPLQGHLASALVQWRERGMPRTA